ncbi:MAG: hypothetical protein NC416_07665 [Eubacterium sp.]|nr:hypothetical protein [Eubacterium sp.]
MTDTRQIRSTWNQQTDRFPDFLAEAPNLFPQINSDRKRENETLVQDFSQKIQKKLRQKPTDKERLKQWEQEVTTELEQDFMDFIKWEKILSLSEWMTPELLQAFKCETKRFLNGVREFDDALTPTQIWQTLRNYFIYAMIVDMQGEAQHAENPILAYSLLYPYTDNYIDDEQISKPEKERYNQMIALKLKGGIVTPQTLLEKQTCRLLDMILDAYEGAGKRKVADTLLQLLEAQNCSINQQKTDVTKGQILEISMWKGSTSVLADYLFATTDWTEYEENFYLKFGFLLQLVDDLQDMEEDSKAGSHTLMTEAAKHHELEQCVNHLLWYTWNVIGEFCPINPTLKGFVRKNCVGIVLLTTAANSQFFSKKYLKALEPYLPFSLNFMKKMKRQREKISLDDPI